MIDVGQKAPEITFYGSDGAEKKLSDFIGKKIVVYFYPKDDTPGCTKEACGFRDDYDDYLEAGAVVVGVSPDNAKSHDKFRNKYNLPFFLSSDEDHSISEAYGVWGEKQMMGRKYMGVFRTTFVLDETGNIIKVFPKVSPEGHSQEVLKALAEN